MKPVRQPIRAALSAIAVVASQSGAIGVFAQDLPEDLIHAEILGGWRTDSGAQMSALRLTLADGWKTYWRAPGDSGIPPQFDWSGSTNVANITYHWPRPQVFDLNGLRTIAYENELVLPIEFQPATPGSPVSVTGEIKLGVCKNICVPITVDVTADLSTGTKSDPVIRVSLDKVPRSAKAAGINAPHCTLEPIRDGLRLTTDIALPAAGQGDFAVVELADTSVWVSSVETRAGDGHLIDVSDLVPSSAKPFALDRSSLRVTIFATSGDVIELRGCTG